MPNTQLTSSPGAGWTKWSGYAIVALVAAAAADATGRLAVIGPVKLTVYQALVAVVAVLAAFAVRQGRIVVSRSRLDVPAALFTATLALSLVMSHDIGLSLTAFASMLSSILLAYLAIYLIDRPEKIPVVVWGVVAVAAAFGVAALLEYFDIFTLKPTIMLVGSGIRSRVTFKDPNVFGSFLAFAMLLGMASLSTLRGLRAKIAAGSGLALILAGMATTQSRGAFMGLLVGAVALLLVASISRKRKLLVATVFLVLAIAAGAALAGNPMFKARVLNVGSDESALIRVWMAESAARAWVDHPFGVGIGDFGVVYRDYADPRIRATLTESHTMYTTLLLELGFLGLAAAGFLAVRWFRTARRALHAADPRVSALARGALAAGLALAAQAFTYSFEASKYLWLAIGLGFAAARLAEIARTDDVSGG